MNMEKVGFGIALDMLKSGRRVASEGWNGKGMWLALVGVWEVVHMDSARAEHELFGVENAPFIGMKTADGCFVPWLASQTDILACDWVVLS